jgi:hypothetical protein
LTTDHMLINIVIVFLCALFNDALSSSDYTMSNGRMTNELDVLWKEAVMA